MIDKSFYLILETSVILVVNWLPGSHHLAMKLDKKISLLVRLTVLNRRHPLLSSVRSIFYGIENGQLKWCLHTTVPSDPFSRIDRRKRLQGLITTNARLICSSALFFGNSRNVVKVRHKTPDKRHETPQQLSRQLKWGRLTRSQLTEPIDNNPNQSAC